MEPTVQRWTARRKAEIVLQVIKGEATLVDICRQNDLKQSEIEKWMDTFIQAGEKGLKTNAREEIAEQEKIVKELHAKVGELVLELDARKKLEALTQSQEKPF